MRPLSLLLLAAALPIGVVAAINVLIDPFCFFGPSNSFVTRKYLYDERDQKTRYIVRSDGMYDGLLIGSSRTAHINSTDFKNAKYFNYASSGLLPIEYSSFIEVAKKRNKITSIVIGFDFFATNASEHPKEYKIATDYELGATYRNLLSFSGIKYSRISISCSARTVCLERSYTTSFARTWNVITPEARKERTRLQLEQYSRTYYSANYRFDPSFETTLKKLRAENPDIKLIGFTTPISQELFELLVDRGLIQHYERWLGLLLENLDEVYDFMGVNSVTSNPNNYIDAHHFSPVVGKYIAQRIEGYSGSVPADFGIKLSASTLHQHLCMFRRAQKIEIGKNISNAVTRKCLV
jgi:hypothetical protein